MAVGLLASGIDPGRAVLFVQSHVPEHSELQWLLNTITPVGELERMTQFKDKSQRVGKCPGWPAELSRSLMAADILLYRADLVPVGEDQTQHLELAREVARKWNAEFGARRGLVPRAQAAADRGQTDHGPRRPGEDVEEPGQHDRAARHARGDLAEAAAGQDRPGARDEEGPRHAGDLQHLYHLHKYFSPPETVATVAENCRGARWGCLDCKRVLADNMIATLAPIRARALDLQAEPDRVDQILGDGAATARRIAGETMREVRARMGFLPSAPAVVAGR